MMKTHIAPVPAWVRWSLFAALLLGAIAHPQDPLFKFTGKDPNEPRNWQKPRNWELNGEPASRVPGTGPDDRVVIPGNEVTNPGNTVKSLILTGSVTGGFLSVTESLALSGGAFRACSVTILDQATATSSAAGLNGFDSCTVINRGTFAPLAVGLGALAGEPPSVLINDPLTGRIELRDGSVIGSSAGGSIQSAGVLVKLAGPGIAQIAGVTLLQSAAGVVECKGGTLQLGFPNPSPGRFVCDRPIVVSAADAIVEINGAASELQSGSRITGPGRALIRHATLTGAVTMENVELPASGVIDGGGDLTVSGLLLLNGGALLGPADPAAPPAAVNLLASATLRLVSNQNGAILGRNVRNAGVVRQEMGDGPRTPLGSTVVFTVENLNDGLIELTSTGGLGPRLVKNQGVLRKLQNSNLNHDQPLANRCENRGLIDLQAGLLRFQGQTQTAGELRVAAGAEARFQGSGAQFTGGVISGSGTLRGVSSSSPVHLACILRPGLNPGNLTLIRSEDSIFLEPSARLEFPINGPLPGTDHPQLILTALGGAFPLAGTIAANFANGFVPSVGQAISLVRYTPGRTAAFTEFTGLAAPGIQWVPRYTATSLDLVAAADPQFHLDSLTPATALGSFQSTVGFAYQVEASTNLTRWTAIGNPLPGTAQKMAISFPITDAPSRFFRLRIL